jgi:GNAT superfamily N-acetyltransferase
MKKTHLTQYLLDSRITIESPPKKDSLQTLDNGLLSEIAKTAPLLNRQVALFLRDDDNRVLGGAIAGMFWSWMDLRFLWVDESVKGQGWGKKLLQAAEIEAKKNECLGITCDTASFQSLDFYLSQGFSIMAKLENRPPRHSSYYLQKRF